MKSKERPRVLTKEGLIHEIKKDHKGPKSQWEGKKKKDPDLVKLEDMQQEEGSRLG